MNNLSDIRYLLSLSRLMPATIREIVETFTPFSRGKAGENLVYLEVLGQ